jgi:Protein of unknown function (DUF1059)
MPITANCPRCGRTILADDASELLEGVRRHVREDHGLDHDLPPKHVAAMLAKQGIELDLSGVGDDSRPARDGRDPA